jgi:dimethylargininase
MIPQLSHQEPTMKLCTHAILREPAKNFVNAIAQDPDHIKPDYEKAMAEYREYAKTLREIGVMTTLCPADEDFPDGNFVEDTYFVLSDKLIIELNPGASSRKDEYKTLRSFLPAKLPLYIIPKEFTIDGGDILKDKKDIYIGISTRTQQEAIDAFNEMVKEHGYRVHAVQVPEGLHLKSGMTRVTHKNFVIQQSFESILQLMKEKDEEVKYFIVPQEEKHAANVLAVNGHIMIPDNCPKTREYIQKFYPDEKIHEISTEQVRLVDGALTCSSLLFRL